MVVIDMQNVSDVENYLFQQKIPNDVAHIKKALAQLELDIDPNKVIIVAGTNGKGTTCTAINAFLIADGKNVGFFSSPHLVKINERIKFNGVDISDEMFCDIFEIVHKKIDNFKLSGFEYLTLMAAYYFFKIYCVDYAIFEVGLGGLYDATNAIPHKFCVVTKLGFDHEHVLGYSLKEIAINKFGIITDNSIIFHTAFSSCLKTIVKDFSDKYNATFVQAMPYKFFVEYTNECPTFLMQTKFGIRELPIPGKGTAENIALALTVCEYLGIDLFNVYTTQICWPGRMEVANYNGREIFLSGDHNPQGIENLRNTLKYYKYNEIYFVVGICFDKHYRKMLKILRKIPHSHICLTETPFKTLKIQDYKESVEFLSSNPKESLQYAIDHSRGMIIVTGSLYLVGAIKVCCDTKASGV